MMRDLRKSVLHVKCVRTRNSKAGKSKVRFLRLLFFLFFTHKFHVQSHVLTKNHTFPTRSFSHIPDRFPRNLRHCTSILASFRSSSVLGSSHSQCPVKSLLNFRAEIVHLWP